MTRRSEPGRAAALAFVALTVIGSAPAWAGFTDATGATAGMSVRSASLAAPTSPAAKAGCVGTLVKAPQVALTWTASASPYATGYAVMRLTAGSYVQIGTVAGRATTSYVDATVSLATTYTYVVRTTYRSWHAASTAVSATTAVLCL